MAALEGPAMEPDFSLLYSELDLPPDCSLEEFKCAYRRRIAELHPDRKSREPPSPEAVAALPELISIYVAVSRFHRRYGRMPGGVPRSTTTATVAGSDPRRAPIASRSTLPVPVAAGAGQERSARPTWRLVALFLALLALMLSWDWLTLAAQ